MKIYSEGWCHIESDLAAQEIARLQSINTKLFDALKNMSEFWAYGMSKPYGTVPTVEDERRVEEIGTAAINALHAADPNYINTLPD